MDFLKLFGEHSLYEDYVYENGILRPNVSYCEFENEVHYNPFISPLEIEFNVPRGSVTQIYNFDAQAKDVGLSDGVYGTNMFDKIEVLVNGEWLNSYTVEEIDDAQGKIYLETSDGIVRYYLKDPSIIPNAAFNGCSDVFNVNIPNGVKSIGQSAFFGCSILNSVNIPSSVEEIGDSAFCSFDGGIQDEAIKQRIASINPKAVDCDFLF